MPDPRKGRTAARWLTAAAAWAVVLFWLWMLYVGEWTAVNCVGGIVMAIVASTVTMAAVHLGTLRYTLRSRWLSTLPAVAWQVVVDFWIITRALVGCITTGRRSCGRFVGRRLDTGGDTVLGASWRAFVGIAATWSPNAYVVDIDYARSECLLHDLVPHRPSESPT